ncbi:ABC transporter ATP-binding protein [Georgenia yuyongxinii]
MADELIAVRDLRRTYGRGRTAVHALRGIDLDVAAGRLLAVRGRSGSGKTTLLNLVGGLDRADGGRVHLGGREVTAMRESELLELRRGTLAYVFQSFGLIPMLTAAENVGVPLRLRRMDPGEREERVAAVLALVGLAAHRNQRPGELSGGQQQRVALARALAPEPRVLLADEPTGQLDSQTGREIMDLIRQLVDEEGLTVVVATHDPALLGVADRVVELTDGRLAQG